MSDTSGDRSRLAAMFRKCQADYSQAHHDDACALMTARSLVVVDIVGRACDGHSHVLLAPPSVLRAEGGASASSKARRPPHVDHVSRTHYIARRVSRHPL